MSSRNPALDELRQLIERFSLDIKTAQTKVAALNATIRAADAAMQALKLATEPSQKALYTAQANGFIQQAEHIKQNPVWKPATDAVSKNDSIQFGTTRTAKVLKEPKNNRVLTTREQIILAKATWLNGVKFPMWEGPPSPQDFEVGKDGSLFLDEASELPLSDFQLDVLDDWKRPGDALPPPSWILGGSASRGPTMVPDREPDLVQDAATDCSVVASFCAGSARVQRGHARLSQNILYPWDGENNHPSMSKNGKYIVRLNFNGCFRKVVIDDRIPTSSTSRVIHVVDRNNPGLLWPALIEKAYLKVRGGYDFPGSNSGTDLWILTGWIPEQIFLQTDDLESDRFWRRISSGHSYGDVMITIGTGKMSRKTEKALGLAGEHDYAVCDLCEVDGQRLMLIKNPWVDGMSWSGRRASILEGDTNPVNSPRDLLNVDEKLKPGTFWMDLDNVIQNFESIYLNWNPGLFSFRQDIHFEWDLSNTRDENGIKTPRGPFTSLQRHRQFAVTTQKTGSVWVLLWRHFQNSVPEDATSADIESGRQYIDLNGHITLASFASNGRRVMLPERYLQKGWFVDSPQTLLKLESCEANLPYTVVPLEQDLAPTKHTFTISGFSNSSFGLAEAAPRYVHSKSFAAEWTRQSAGGNVQMSTYCTNPQFSLAVVKKTNVSFLLEACEVDINVNVKLVHSNGTRIQRIRNRDIIVDSKEYRPGACLAEFEGLEPGGYTIICSTFEADQLSAFELLVESSEHTETRMLAREGAGRIRTQLSSAIFEKGQHKLAIPLYPRRLVNFYVVAQHIVPHIALGTASARTPSSWSHILLYVQLGKGSRSEVLVCSNDGEHEDSATAVRTEPIDLGPDFRRRGYQECWLVLDRMCVTSEAAEELFDIQLYVDQIDGFDVGKWCFWDD